MTGHRYASAFVRPGAASRSIPSAQRLLARWEAAAALMLATPPTAEASLGLARMLPVWMRWRQHPVAALIAAAARHPNRIALIDDAGQEVSAVGVRAGDNQRGHVEDVRRQPGCFERAEKLARGHEDLAAHVAALLLAGQLVLEMDAGRPGLDHGLHQLECVERPTEAGLSVGHNGHEIVDVLASLGPALRQHLQHLLLRACDVVRVLQVLRVLPQVLVQGVAVDDPPTPLITELIPPLPLVASRKIVRRSWN